MREGFLYYLLNGHLAIEQQIGTLGCGVDMALIHRANLMFVLMADRRGGTASFGAVANKAPFKAERIGGTDKDAPIIERVDCGPIKGKEALDE